MATTPLTLSPCLLEAAKLLFPTLDFSRLRFYYKEFGTEPHTIAYFTRTEITFVRPVFACSVNDTSFLTLCHELVHALQKQDLLNRIVRNSSSWTCGLLHGQSENDYENCIEKEAWDYENQLKAWLTAHNVSPCSCDYTALVGGLDQVNSKFADAINADGSIVKSSIRDCYPWDCLGPGILRVFAGIVIMVSSLIWSIPAVFVDGVVGTVGAIVGGMIGGAAGVIVGIMVIGMVIGPLIGGLIGLIIGSIIGALIGDIVDWLVRLFGDDGGALNLMFSQDQGMTFDSHVGFERSCEPMSLSFGLRMKSNGDKVDRLAIAYTGTDNHVNLITLPSDNIQIPFLTKIDFQESEDCGPAVIHDGVRLHLAWQGTDNSLNTITTTDGTNLAHHRTLPSKTPGDASPAMCVVGGKNILAYMDQALNVKLRVGDGIDWKAAIPLNEKADSETTVAITATVGNEFAIAWVGAEKLKRINILNLTVDQTTGTVTRGAKFTLVERSNAGPALAFGERAVEGNGPFLYLAWTGFDQRINFMRSRDFGKTWENKLIFGKSRGDCGPALAVHGDSGAICVGWTGE